MAKETKIKKTSIFQQTEFTLGLIIVILFVGASLFTDNFCTLYNVTNLMKQCAIIGVMAAAQTMIIITGGIDISGGAITGLSCMVLALLQRDTHMNMWITLLIAVIIAIAVGFLNGIIIYDLQVPPMIATLGMQTIVRGFVKIISNALTVTGIDQRILSMGNTNVFGVLPVLAIIWAIVAVIIWFILKYAIFGRSLYVLGSGVEVAKLSGIKVRKMFYATYGTHFRELEADGYPAEEYGIDPRQAKVEDAQAELAEAGYPNGEGFPEVEITYANTEKNKRLCEAIQQMLETNLNIKVKLRAEESSVFNSTKSKGDYEMAPGGWTNNPYDASGLIKLFYSQNGNNTCQWRWREYKGAPHDTTLNPGNKAFDEAFDKAMASLGKERDEAWEEANKALMDDMPITALYYPSFVALINEDQVENVELTLGNSFMFSHAEIVE